MPHTMSEPVTSAGSPIDTGNRVGVARAATAAIISSAVYSLEAVVHSGRDLRLRLEPVREPRLLLQVGAAVRDAVHEFVEIPPQRGGGARGRLPADVERIVSVVVALRVRRMRAP